MGASDQDPAITMTVTIPNADVAWQLAQFCKRMNLSRAIEFTEGHLSHDDRQRDAYLMLDGIEAVQRGLLSAGFSPR